MSDIIFEQLFEPESSTYTYLLADPTTREAVIIDPVLEMVERDLSLIQKMNLELRFILETHIHADHITGAGRLKKATQAQTALSALSGVDCADILLGDGDRIPFGIHHLTAITTPGHTDSCMTYACNDRLFTGDALLIGGTGRTDFQNGSAETLYESITQKIFSFSDETLVYPGHDYKGRTHSTIKEERLTNPRLGRQKTKAEFVQIMHDLQLPHPRKIASALPANLRCGQI